MFIRDLKQCPEFTGGDESILRELFNPLKDNLALGYSLAFARVEPGKTTSPHRLTNSEVYFILAGTGEMTIDGEKAQVKPLQAVYIPPGSVQHITNTGEVSLDFLCLVDPAWQPNCEEIL